MFPSSIANVQRIQLLENQRASTIGLLIEGILYTSRHVSCVQQWRGAKLNWHKKCASKGIPVSECLQPGV